MAKHVIYTDGSYSGKEPGVVHGGVIFWDEVADKATDMYHVYTKDKAIVSGNNVGGECLAAWLGMLMFVADAIESKEYENEECTFEIISDYEGVMKWMNGEWSNHSRPSSNWYYNAMTDLLDYAYTVSPNMKFKFSWTRGHMGVNGAAGNNMADAIAAWDMSGVHIYEAKVYRFEEGKLVEENG